MRAIVASAPIPGGTRQSTSSSARAGITLIFSPAEMIVGATVTPSVGSNIAASRGSTARDARDGARRVLRVVADRAQERARLVGDVEGRRGGSRAARSRARA